MTQLVTDPYFNDPTKWSVSATEGTAVVTGGKLVCTGFRGTVTCPTMQPPVIGIDYKFIVGIDSFGGVGLAQIKYGDVVGGSGGQWLWTGAEGTGVFTGYGAASTTLNLTIAIAFTADDLVIDRILISQMHIRELIREAAATAVTGLTTTGSNVFQSRAKHIQESELPCLLVYTREETIDYEQGTLDAPQRLLTLTVEGRVKASANVDDTLDDIAEEVETALGADITLGGYSHGLDLQSTSIEFNDESDQSVGSISLNYIVQYRTPFGDPTTVA